MAFRKDGTFYVRARNRQKRYYELSVKGILEPGAGEIR
jgi:hypothetical protein